METFLVAILGSMSTVTLTSIGVYLSRNWLIARLNASIKHEYDVKLESYKSQVTRSEQAYEEIINALYDMISYFRVHKEDYGQGTGLSEERESELMHKYILASSSLSKATDIGTFYISDKAGDILSKLRQREQLDYYNEPKFDFFEQEYQEHKLALEKVMKIAKLDLKRTN
ncbi:hypothetical protein [Aliivibrio fischeri]|uniref:hypothetical protein n=1 Tax=Aliivibrio fischeri TaxID=668 RepID=UPI0009082246|nr:hypothetical protein [Aliivibrio fischeri]